MEGPWLKIFPYRLLLGYIQFRGTSESLDVSETRSHMTSISQMRVVLSDPERIQVVSVRLLHLLSKHTSET